MVTHLNTGCPRGVMVKAMHSGIVVREFVLQSRNYDHLRTNTLGKGLNPLILPAMYHYCSSRRMALALNNLKRVDMPLNKETKSNHLSTEHVYCCLTVYFASHRIHSRGSSGVLANVLDCDISLSEFELKSLYYIHLRTNTFVKFINYPLLLWVR